MSNSHILQGSRSVVVNMEAKGATASTLGRKCVVVRWADLQLESLLELVQRGAGSLLLLLPQNFTDVQGEIAEVSGSVAYKDEV